MKLIVEAVDNEWRKRTGGVGGTDESRAEHATVLQEFDYLVKGCTKLSSIYNKLKQEGKIPTAERQRQQRTIVD